MADYALTRGIDRFPQYVPEGEAVAIALDGERAYMFNRSGDVVTTKRQPGENEETLRFRLRAGLTAVTIYEARHDAP